MTVIMTIETTLLELWHKKEAETGRKLKVSEVAKDCDLSHHTVTSMLNGKTSQFSKEVLDKFCEYFGIEDGPIPFLVYENESGKI